jgi:hypothetical protein
MATGKGSPEAVPTAGGTLALHDLEILERA